MSLSPMQIGEKIGENLFAIFFIGIGLYYGLKHLKKKKMKSQVKD